MCAAAHGHSDPFQKGGTAMPLPTAIELYPVGVHALPEAKSAPRSLLRLRLGAFLSDLAISLAPISVALGVGIGWRAAVAVATVAVVAFNPIAVGRVADWYLRMMDDLSPYLAHHQAAILWPGCGQPGSPGNRWGPYHLLTPTEIYHSYFGRLVRVSMAYTDSRWWQAAAVEDGRGGSGLVVASDGSSGLVVTNRHVVDPSYGSSAMVPKECVKNLVIAIRTPYTMKQCKAELAAILKRFVRDDGQDDLALLIIRLDRWPVWAAPIVSFDAILPGEEAVAIGCPQALDFTVSQGVISQLRPDRHEIQISCPISCGSSGGPLFLRKGGLFAGVTTGSIDTRDAQNLNFALPADRLANANTWSFERKDLEPTVRKLLGMIDVVKAGSHSVPRKADNTEDLFMQFRMAYKETL